MKKILLTFLVIAFCVSCDFLFQKDVKIESIEISSSDVYLFIGEQEEISVTINPEDVINPNLNWIIEDGDGCLSLSQAEDGSVIITAKSEGTVSLYAECDGVISNRLFFYISSEPSLSIEIPSSSFSVGDSFLISMNYGENVSGDDKQFVILEGKDLVSAKDNNDGTVTITALSEGIVSIAVQLENRYLSSTSFVINTAPEVELSSSSSMLEVGNSISISIKSEDIPLEDFEFVVLLGEDLIEIVNNYDGTATVNAIASGECNIVAEANGVRSNVISLTVEEPEIVFDIIEDAISLLVGENTTIEVSSSIDGDISWYVLSGEDYVEITGTSENSIKIYAKAEGEAEIIAYMSDFSDSVKISVEDPGYRIAEDGTWEIYNANGLYAFYEYWDWSNTNVILLNDITVNDTQNWESWNEDSADLKIWRAIGRDSINSYKGVFDGKGHTICGLYSNIYYSGSYNNGFFSIIDDSGVVKNLSIEESYFNGGPVGAIASVNYGTIENCSSNIIVGEEKQNVMYKYVGGIAGENRGTILKCTNYSNILLGDRVGGIAGENNSSIDSSVNNGSFKGRDDESYVGGIMGDGEGVVTSCTNYGDIEGKYAGGIMGGDGIVSSIKDCTNYGTIRGENAGGIVGRGYGIIENCINKGAIKFLTNSERTPYLGGIAGYFSYRNRGGSDGTIVTILNSRNEGDIYFEPKFSSFCAGGIVASTYNSIVGSVNTGDIFNPEGVVDVLGGLDYVRAGGIAGEVIYSDIYHTYEITDCINEGDILFTLSEREIEENSNYSICCGGIVALSGSGTISNCLNTGKIVGTTSGGIIATKTSYYDELDKYLRLYNVKNSGEIIGYSDAGGIAGYLFDSIISNSYNDADFDGVNVEYSFDNNWTSNVAGLIGVSEGNLEITKCFNVGHIGPDDYFSTPTALVAWPVSSGSGADKIIDCYYLAGCAPTPFFNMMEGDSYSENEDWIYSEKTIEEMKSSQIVDLLNEGQEENWYYSPNSYPKLLWEKDL